MASAAAQSVNSASSFLLNVDRAEKARWKGAADAAGLSMSEYVRRAVRQADEAPTPQEIAAVRELAAQVSAAADRIGDKLDGTLARIAKLLDPAEELKRRDAILAQLEEDGVTLDLDVLAQHAA